MKTKRTIAAVLAVAMLLSLASCGTKQTAQPETKKIDLTIEDMINANSAESLFSNHKNVLIHFDGGYDIYVKNIYRSYEYYWQEYDDREFLVDSENNWMRFKDNGDFCYDFYAVPEEELPYYKWYTSDFIKPLLVQSTSAETITDLSLDSEGKIHVRTILDAETATEQLISDGLPEELQGYEIESFYVLDAETLELLEAESYILTEGEKTLDVKQSYEYDVDYPDLMKEEIAMAEEYAASLKKEPEHPKVVTIVYDAGTEKETSYSITIEQGRKIRYFLLDGYVENKDKATEITKDGVQYITKYAEPIQ